VIKIRYSDLPAGLHASASSEGRHTIIYLVPGLSAADRQGAIDRLRASARVGHGPQLPAVSLALALIADRIRLNLRNAVAAARLHPIGAAIPVVVLAGGAILYALFVTVSIRLGSPQSAQAPLPLSAVSAPASTGSAPGDSGGVVGPTSATRLTGASSARRASHRGSTTGEQVVGAHPVPSSPTPSPDPSVSSSSPPGHPSPPPSPGSPSPSPLPTRSHGSGGICLNLGVLTICVHL
jgi:hypothetical protein